MSVFVCAMGKEQGQFYLNPSVTDMMRRSIRSGYHRKAELDFIWVVLLCSDMAVFSEPCSSIPRSCPWDSGAIQKRPSSKDRGRGSRAQWAGSYKGGGC